MNVVGDINATGTVYSNNLNLTRAYVWVTNGTFLQTANWNATNSSYALNQTLTDMWSPFLSTTNVSYLMIDRFNVTNKTYRTMDNVTFPGLFVNASHIATSGVNTTHILDNTILAIDLNSDVNTSMDLRYFTKAQWNVTNESYLKDYGDTATGNYTFDAGTLFIGSDTDRVGIGKLAPTTTLDVNGTINASQMLVNGTAVLTINQWNATNSSYALNQTLTDMWTPFLSTTNASYLMIDKFNVTNTTYREKYNLTWVGNLNSTATVYSEGVNNLTIPFLFNSTGLIRNWNISGDIQNWNASTYIRNWGIDTSLLNTTNLTYLMIDRFNVTNTTYYPIWNPYGYYNSTNPSPVTNESYLKDYGDTATGNYTFDTNTLFIDSSGNLIGIGTTSPAAKLHVNTTDNSTTPLQIQGLNATGQQVTLLSTQNVTGNTTSLTDFCISGGKCLSGVISSEVETDPMWTANITNYFTKAQWNVTNASYALNQTLTDMWTPFLSTTNSSYLMVDKFNVTNSSYREKYNLTWVGNLNSTATVYSEGVNNLTIPFLFNSTGLIRNWNISGDIQNWNASTYIRNWGIDTSLLNTTNLTYLMIDRFNVTNTTYYPIWNPFGFYNSTNPSPVTNDSYLKDYGDTATGNYTFDTNTLFIDSSGNLIGIGTTSPTAKLHVNTTDNTTTPLQIQGLNATGQQVTLLSTQNVTGNTTSLTDFCISGGKCLSGVISSGAETDPMWTANITNYFTKAQWNATNASYALNQTLTDMWTPFLSTTNSSYLMIDKFNVTNTTYREKYNLTWVGNLNVTQNFSVNNNNLFVDSATGNVGIGTTAPGTKLHILGSSDSVLRIENSGANSNPGIEIKNDAETWTLQTVGARADNFEIYDVGSGATRLAIDQSGNVGIGTTVLGKN